MGIGPYYRANNPYTHSDASYNAMANSYKNEIAELKAIIAKNPDPINFEILDVYNNGQYTLLRVKYPNCTNAEGIKILLMLSSPVDLLKRKSLDPHFGNNNSPVARFQPSDDGWILAKKFTDWLVNNEN